MKRVSQRWNCRVFLGLAIAIAMSGCATASVRSAAAPARVRPDPRGEPLALLPTGAVSWGRFDLAVARQSPHFARALETARTAGVQVDEVQRALGFDALHSSSMLAYALYLPPGGATVRGGWPIVYARGGFSRDALLTDARRAGPIEQGRESGVEYFSVGQRVLIFPTDDVVLVLPRALLRREAERLSGIASDGLAEDTHFASAWSRIGGAEGPLRVAVDLAAIRARAPTDLHGAPPAAGHLDLLVARAEVPAAVTVLAAGLASDRSAAEATVRGVRALVSQVRGAIVTLLGLGRLLREGITVSNDDRWVSLTVRADEGEARRAMRIVTLLGDETSPQ